MGYESGCAYDLPLKLGHSLLMFTVWKYSVGRGSAAYHVVYAHARRVHVLDTTGVFMHNRLRASIRTSW